MSYKRLKRHHRGRQPGDVFLASRTLSGDLPRDIAKEKYLQQIVQETKTHDINVAQNKLSADGKSTAIQLQHLKKSIDKAAWRLGKDQRKFEFLQRKLEVLEEIQNILEKIQRSGQSRIGDTHFKTIVLQVLRDKKIDPELLTIKF